MTVFLEQLTSTNALGLQAEAKLELEGIKTQLETKLNPQNVLKIIEKAQRI